MSILINSAGIASRGNGGQISFRDWMGVGADEYAYIAPDPLNPDIIYGGRVLKFNKKRLRCTYSIFDRGKNLDR